MNTENQKRAGVFQRAWEIIEKDNTIPLEDREGILKLIQVLIEAGASSTQQKKDDQVKSYTQEASRPWRCKRPYPGPTSGKPICQGTRAMPALQIPPTVLF